MPEMEDKPTKKGEVRTQLGAYQWASQNYDDTMVWHYIMFYPYHEYNVKDARTFALGHLHKSKEGF